MKMMKWALLGGAALAVTATAARADDLSALKAQIEALQTRVSQLEAQPQAAAPSAEGFSLLAIRDGQGTFEGELPTRVSDRQYQDQGYTFSVMPSADVAPVAEVSVSAEIRTLLWFTDDARDAGNGHRSDDNLDVANRGRVFIKGKIDTAVGEVGGYVRFQASGGGDLGDYDQTAKMTYAYGWWKFAPNWELSAGRNDMTAALITNWDWNETSPIDPGPSDAGQEQMRLTYTSGPVAFAIAVGDPDNFTQTSSTTTNVVGCVDDNPANGKCDVGEDATLTPITTTSSKSVDRSDLPNLQASLSYTSDAFTAQIAGLVQDDNEGDDLDWAVGGGAMLGIADHFTVMAAAVVGSGTDEYTNNLGPASVDDDFWGGSVGIIAHLSEDTRLEVGAGIEDYDQAGEADGVNAGVFWDPVSQVTVGLAATWLDYTDQPTGNDGDVLQVFFGTWLRFP
jgi:hypothetical protein